MHVFNVFSTKVFFYDMPIHVEIKTALDFLINPNNSCFGWHNVVIVRKISRYKCVCRDKDKAIKSAGTSSLTRKFRYF